MRVFHKSSICALLALAVVTSLTACNQNAAAPTAGKHAAAPFVPPPIDVTRINLGSAVAADGTISEASATFKPTSTIYAAVTTERSAQKVGLRARWTFQDGTVVKDETKVISPTGELVTDFQTVNISGWPLGRYKFEILIKNQAVAVTEYDVAP